MERETHKIPAAEPKGSSGWPADGVGSDERAGPVAVERLRKDDGRALILYARAREDGEDGGDGGEHGDRRDGGGSGEREP
jgi:hypothetical protein